MYMLAVVLITCLLVLEKDLLRGGGLGGHLRGLAGPPGARAAARRVEVRPQGLEALDGPPDPGEHGGGDADRVALREPQRAVLGGEAGDVARERPRGGRRGAVGSGGAFQKCTSKGIYHMTTGHSVET